MIYLVIFLLYAVGVSGEFQFDDYAWIHNQLILGKPPYVPMRPVQSVIMQGIHLWFGVNPVPHKILSLLLHAGVVVALMHIARRFKRSIWGVALFAVHPVLVGTVTYIIQSSVILCALFMLWAFICWDKKRYFLCAVLFLLALGSKQIAIMFPVVIFLYEWLFKRDKTVAFPLLVLSGVCLFVATMTPINGLIEARGFSPWERLCSQADLLPMYFNMVVFPCVGRYTVSHDIVISGGVCSLLLSGVVFFTVLLCVNNKAKFMMLGLVVLMIPEFTIMDLELVFEHRLYTLLAFLCMFAPEIKKSKYSPALAMMYFTFLIWCMIVSVQYQMIWRKQSAMWEHTLKVYPKSFRAHFNYAKLIYKIEPLKAMYHFNELRHCEDRRNGRWEEELRITWKWYHPTIIKELSRFERWMKEEK